MLKPDLSVQLGVKLTNMWFINVTNILLRRSYAINLILGQTFQIIVNNLLRCYNVFHLCN